MTEQFSTPGHPVWAIALSIFFMASTPIVTYAAVFYVKARVRSFRRQRAMWRQLNAISRGSYMRERPRV